MKTSLKSALLLTGVLGFGIATMLPQIAPVRADEDAPAAATTKEKKPHAKVGHSGKMQQMLDQLGLSDEQKTQIDAITKDNAEKRKALRANPDPDKKVNRQKNMDLMKETNDKIRAVLTLDQQKKLDDLIAQAKADRKANGKTKEDKTKEDKTKEDKTARADDHHKRVAQADGDDGNAGNAGDDNNKGDDDGNMKKPDDGENGDAGNNGDAGGDN